MQTMIALLIGHTHCSLKHFANALGRSHRVKTLIYHVKLKRTYATYAYTYNA